MLSFYGIILMGDIMELRDVIESRRSIRKYTDELVDENIILEAIKYGIMAPSAHNRQPWKVKLIKGEDKDKIAEALILKTQDIPGHTGVHTAGVIKNVPYLLVIYYDEIEGANREHDLLSLGAFIEHIILYLTEAGLGTLWIANTNIVKEEVSEITGVNLETISTIGIGVKDQDPKMRPRKDIEEIIL